MKYKKKEYNRVCYVATIYVLMLYLLYSSEDEIRQTLFIIDQGSMPDSISDKLIGQAIIVNNQKYQGKIYQYLVNHTHGKFRSRIEAWYCRRTYDYYVPKFEGDEVVFAQDHLYLSPYICGREFTLFEDSPMNFSVRYSKGADKKEKPASKNIKFRNYLFGKGYLYKWGNSPFIKKIILTIDDPAPYIQDKQREIINIQKIWRNSPAEKQAIINQIFDLKEEDIQKLNSKPIVILTQSLYKDMVSTEIHTQIYQKIVSNYPADQIMLKVHYRDQFDYRSLFPHIMIYNKPIPTQLLTWQGWKPRRLVTCYSSAVCDIASDAEIDWYGTEINEELQKKEGVVQPPSGVNLCH